MIKFRLQIGEASVEVSIAVDDGNKTGIIEYEGDADIVELLRDLLAFEYGAFGHLIGSATTPIDLDAAMKSPALAQWQPELIEGAELVASYDPGIPEGAVT